MPTITQSDPFVQKMPRSALRHRPIQSETSKQKIAVLTPRASQFSTKHTTVAPVTASNLRKRGDIRGSWLIYLVLGMVVAMLLLWVGQLILNWGHTVSDDLHYGRPRTTNMDRFVGHETGNTPSHFVALNLNGQIYVLEIPGGSANTSHLLVGPHLIGPNADLAPVSLAFPGDPHHPDLLIVVGSIQVRFHNTGNTYVPVP
jgi:hypothetical protein